MIYGICLAHVNAHNSSQAQRTPIFPRIQKPHHCTQAKTSGLRLMLRNSLSGHVVHRHRHPVFVREGLGKAPRGSSAVVSVYHQGPRHSGTSVARHCKALLLVHVGLGFGIGFLSHSCDAGGSHLPVPSGRGRGIAGEGTEGFWSFFPEVAEATCAPRTSHQPRIWFQER